MAQQNLSPGISTQSMFNTPQAHEGYRVRGSRDDRRLASLVDSSYELSCVLALAIASSPRGELSGNQMDALTDLSYQTLINIAEMREILALAPDQLTTGQN
jgi:hypothetical protein